MQANTHARLTRAFLAANSLFWLPWGLICVIWPKAWAGDVIPGMEVFELSDAVARTEVRAMYGGLQMAIGVFALLGVFRPAYRRAALLFFVLALTGLAASRFGGMVAEGDDEYLRFVVGELPAGRYNQVGLAMYELPNLLLAWALLLLSPKQAEIDVDALLAENERLRRELDAATLVETT